MTDSTIPGPEAQPASTPPPDGAAAPASRWATLRPKRGLLAATIVAVAAIDQLTKIIAVENLENRPSIDLIGEWFQLTLLRNPGAAFSMGTGSTWLFTTIQIVFIVAVAVASKWLRTPWPAVSAGLIAGGAAGNLIDRLFRDPSFYFGHVVDFLAVRGFAVFNLADAAITVGVIMLAGWIMFSSDVDEMTEEKESGKKKSGEKESRKAVSGKAVSGKKKEGDRDA
ncbi:signal peptidase II [uncultured Corynebacterium sp.]|uniref:signal peptidase II n=1 Tax=uncultured Corynebacterium sp. TaxID=159447 RepID=UPI0025E0D4F5|nr:signal peptidase II [uncultured Corynebacterium sp.]